MADDPHAHEEHRRAALLREERRADIKDAVREVLKEELGTMIATALWSDMRPPRKWEDIRTYLEQGFKAEEARKARGKFFRNAAGDTLGEFVKTMAMHLVISTGIMAAIFQFFVHWSRSP